MLKSDVTMASLPIGSRGYLNDLFQLLYPVHIFGRPRLLRNFVALR